MANPKNLLRRAGVTAVHSLDRFVLSVPDLAQAQRFYQAFGLDARMHDGWLDLHTFGPDHREHAWASIFGGVRRKRLEYLRFGIDAHDVESFRRRISLHGLACEPHPLSDGSGLWLASPDGMAMQLAVADKVSPSHKCQPVPPPRRAPGKGAAPARSQAAAVRPRALSHVLCFTADVPRMLEFCIQVLGLRLSDRSGDAVAFLHTPHGSDHHLVAFAKSAGPGLHHSSWDVGSLDEVGCGAEQMRLAGYDKGWGMGRHVLGSNYFHYVRDPWGSFAEYSFDIDFVPHTVDWPAANHPAEDSSYLWGPVPPDDIITNHEIPREGT